jgi:hypothetical protein
MLLVTSFVQWSFVHWLIVPGRQLCHGLDSVFCSRITVASDYLCKYGPSYLEKELHIQSVFWQDIHVYVTRTATTSSTRDGHLRLTSIYVY